MTKWGANMTDRYRFGKKKKLIIYKQSICVTTVIIVKSDSNISLFKFCSNLLGFTINSFTKLKKTVFSK